MGEGRSKCNRCDGMMIYEKIYHEADRFWVWKCVNCGECIDPVILENRQFQKSKRKNTRPAKTPHVDLTLVRLIKGKDVVTAKET